MSLFSRLYTGVFDSVYGFKLGRFRSRIEKQEKALQSHIIRQKKVAEKPDFSKMKDVLIIKNESMSDVLMATSLIRNLAVRGYKVSLLTSQEGQMVVEHNPYIYELIIQTTSAGQSKQFGLEQFKDKHYDLVLDLRNPEFDGNFDELLFPQHISCDYLLAWNRSNIGIYDDSVGFYDESGYFVDLVAAFLSYMGIDDADLSSDLMMTESSRTNGLAYIRDLWRKGGPVIALCPFSKSVSHNLAELQINGILDKILQKYPFAQIVLLGHHEKVNQIHLEEEQEKHVHKYISPAWMDVVPLLKYVDVVITSNLPLCHMASVFEKPTVAFSLCNEGSVGQEKVKREYERQMKLLQARFFDAPEIDAGHRGKDVLIGDQLLMPHHEKIELLYSTSEEITDLASNNIADAFQRLVTQYVRDPQYVSSARSTSATEEKKIMQIENNAQNQKSAAVDDEDEHDESKKEAEAEAKA